MHRSDVNGHVGGFFLNSLAFLLYFCSSLLPYSYSYSFFLHCLQTFLSFPHMTVIFSFIHSYTIIPTFCLIQVVHPSDTVFSSLYADFPFFLILLLFLPFFYTQLGLLGLTLTIHKASILNILSFLPIYHLSIHPVTIIFLKLLTIIHIYPSCLQSFLF